MNNKNGDRLKIRKDLNTDIEYVLPQMLEHKGRIVTVREAVDDEYYLLKEVGWMWSDEMLEPLTLKEQYLRTGNVVEFANGERYIVLCSDDNVALANLNSNTSAYQWECSKVYNDNLENIDCGSRSDRDIIRVYDRVCRWKEDNLTLIWENEVKINKLHGIFAITDEYIPIYFKEDDLDSEVYPVYERAKRLGNFKFYQKKSEPNYYYVELLGSGKVVNLFKQYNVENWLRSWLDDDGIPSVTKYDIKRAFKEEGVDL